MGRKEKLKSQRREEQKQMEIVGKESKKKRRIFAVLSLLAAIAGYQGMVALGKDRVPEPAVEARPANHRAVIETERGNMTLELYTADAPQTVENFLKLVRAGFYDGILFHRVEPGFVIQAGDPATKGERGKDFVYQGEENLANLPIAGTGGPGYTFEDEINPWSLGLDESIIELYEKRGYAYRQDLMSHKIVVGSLAMANSGANTNGSQFFIVTEKEQPALDGLYTNFGQVVEGQEIAQSIQRGERIIKIDILE